MNRGRSAMMESHQKKDCFGIPMKYILEAEDNGGKNIHWKANVEVTGMYGAQVGCTVLWA